MLDPGGRQQHACVCVCLCLQVCGSVLLSAGLWLRSGDTSLLHTLLLHHSPVPPLTADELFSLFAIGAGASIALLSLVGCYGACAHNRCLLSTVSQESHGDCLAILSFAFVYYSYVSSFSVAWSNCDRWC